MNLQAYCERAEEPGLRGTRSSWTCPWSTTWITTTALVFRGYIRKSAGLRAGRRSVRQGYAAAGKGRRRGGFRDLPGRADERHAGCRLRRYDVDAAAAVRRGNACRLPTYFMAVTTLQKEGLSVSAETSEAHGMPEIQWRNTCCENGEAGEWRRYKC